MSKISGPHGQDAFAASPTTPGSLGHNDAADPSTPDSFVGDTPGPLGQGDSGDPDQANAPKFTWSNQVLFAGPVVATAAQKQIVVTSQEKGWYAWARQFAARSGRDLVAFPVPLTMKEIMATYKKAARLAGRGGMLIISAGHGYAERTGPANVNLAPRTMLRITHAHFTTRILQNAKDKEILKNFTAIGDILQDAEVGKVLFISCYVGRSMDFLQEIANRWNVTAIGYRKLVMPGYFTVHRRGTRTYFLYLGETPPADVKEQEYLSWNYPRLDRENAWHVPPDPKKVKKRKKQAQAPEESTSNLPVPA